MRKCPKCAEEIKAEAQICKHCNSDVTPLSDQEKKALIKEAKKANNVPWWGVLLAFGACGFFIWNQAQNPDSTGTGSSGLFSSNCEIQVSGSPGQEFSGSYMVVTSGGKSEQKSVDGVAPESYKVSGSIVSANFQKKSENGTLKAVIKKDGRVVADSDTSASYGVVSVATN